VRNEATKLRERPEFARDKLKELPETNFFNWAKVESFDIAKRDVYLEAKPLGSPKRDDATPAVPDEYMKTAKAVAQRQMVLAGYRLADVLVGMTK
jgi:hypothetical protein